MDPWAIVVCGLALLGGFLILIYEFFFHPVKRSFRKEKLDGTEVFKRDKAAIKKRRKEET